MLKHGQSGSGLGPASQSGCQELSPVALGTHSPIVTSEASLAAEAVTQVPLATFCTRYCPDGFKIFQSCWSDELQAAMDGDFAPVANV